MGEAWLAESYHEETAGKLKRFAHELDEKVLKQGWRAAGAGPRASASRSRATPTGRATFVERHRRPTSYGAALAPTRFDDRPDLGGGSPCQGKTIKSGSRPIRGYSPTWRASFFHMIRWKTFCSAS
ncbi:hypothetical protein GCM10027570_44980 [Streptomonospora sediminis]